MATELERPVGCVETAATTERALHAAHKMTSHGRLICKQKSKIVKISDIVWRKGKGEIFLYPIQHFFYRAE